MKAKLFSFIKMFISNSEVIKAAKAGVLITALVLFINVSLVSAPNYISYMRGVNNIENLEGINGAFSDMFDDPLPCSIDEDHTMACDLDESRTYNGYAVSFEQDVDPDEVDETSIIFTPDYSVIVYHEGDERVVVDGDYSLLEGYDFSNIKNSAEDEENPETFYANNTDFFLRNLYYSDLNDTVGLIYTVQFAQTFLYVIFLSLMYMMLNYKASMKKITYPASLRVIIFSMTGPALLSALVGMWFSSWSYVLFTIVYLIRIIVLYYRLHRSKVTIGQDGGTNDEALT
ncbi:MAG: hypothetical protein ACOCU0_01500 [Bacillota bacterium]